VAPERRQIAQRTPDRTLKPIMAPLFQLHVEKIAS